MMCRSKSTKSQIVATLKQVEGGRHVKDACRELGISEAMYDVWTSKCGGMEAADVQRLRDLETEPQLLQHDSLCGLTPIQFRDQHQPTSNVHF